VQAGLPWAQPLVVVVFCRDFLVVVVVWLGIWAPAPCSLASLVAAAALVVLPGGVVWAAAALAALPAVAAALAALPGGVVWAAAALAALPVVAAALAALPGIEAAAALAALPAASPTRVAPLCCLAGFRRAAFRC